MILVSKSSLLAFSFSCADHPTVSETDLMISVFDLDGECRGGAYAAKNKIEAKRIWLGRNPKKVKNPQNSA